MTPASDSGAAVDPLPTRWARDELIGLLSVSATLAGLCITIVAFMATFNKARSDASVVDDLLALCAAVFLLCTWLTFFALRAQRPAVARLLTKLVDLLFLGALSGMIVSGFLLVYTIW